MTQAKVRLPRALVLAIGGVMISFAGLAAEAEDSERVRAANQAFYEAASARDLDRMDEIWAHEAYVRAIHPTNVQPDAGWKAVRAGWEKLFGAFTEITGSMPQPHVQVGEELAWVTGEETFVGRRSTGEEFSVTLLGTSVFEKVGDRWLMVHHHVSVPLRPRQ